MKETRANPLLKPLPSSPTLFTLDETVPGKKIVQRDLKHDVQSFDLCEGIGQKEKEKEEEEEEGGSASMVGNDPHFEPWRTQTGSQTGPLEGKSWSSCHWTTSK